MKETLVIIVACVICGCDNHPNFQKHVPVRVKIVSVNDPGTFQDRFASAVVELPNGRRLNIYGRFGRVGDSFVLDVPESDAKEIGK